MTPDDLRLLASEATPGPWQIRPDSDRHVQNWEGPHRFWWLCRSPEDARLIVLAPSLALLCAELGEALEEITRDSYPRRSEPVVVARAALAKLEALEATHVT
jgi:hypothetical protein